MALQYRFEAKYGIARDFYIVLEDTADPEDFEVNPILATGDFTISKDGGTFANLGTDPTVVPAGGRQVKVPLSAAELSAKQVTILGVDLTATAAWLPVVIYIVTYGNAAAQHKFDQDNPLVTVEANLDKTGYGLASTGLDSVATPADVISAGDAQSSLAKMLRWMFNRLAFEHDATASLLRTKNASGSVVTQQTLSNDGTTQTVGKIS